MYTIKKIDWYISKCKYIDRKRSKSGMSKVRTMFCKFCRDAGRDDYTSHNVRGPGGKLTCKFLAQIECLSCGEKGHTSGYCYNKCRDKLGCDEPVKKYIYQTSRVEKSFQATNYKNVVLNPFALLEECEEVDLDSAVMDSAVMDSAKIVLSETDDDLSSSDERVYDEEDMENARNCTIDFSTIPLTWGKIQLSAWI